jgi:hypothetical protein
MRNLASPRACRRAVNPMQQHDRLPPALRQWATAAALPWSAKSLRRLWHSALTRAGSPEAALALLDRAQHQTLACEARRVWGPHHPAAQPGQ